MSKSRVIRLATLGMISELSLEDQEKYKAAYDELKAVLQKHGGPGEMALAVVTLEKAEEHGE